VTDADTGRPAVERVIRCDELFGRSIDGFLPDVCVVWADRSRIGRFQLPGRGTTEGPRTDPRTGQHRHLGFMLGAGHGITQSEEQTTGTILDVAPTALALLDVDRPPELPGRPIEAFTGA
jgi:predicted AlkP superfamily phosphohydrolase/phosphomutase